MSGAAVAPRPAHVPDALVIVFDFMAPGPPGSDPFVA